MAVLTSPYESGEANDVSALMTSASLSFERAAHLMSLNRRDFAGEMGLLCEAAEAYRGALALSPAESSNAIAPRIVRGMELELYMYIYM